MTDDEIVKLVWGVMVLKRRFEDVPYSFSGKQIKLVKDQEDRKFDRDFARHKDLLVIKIFLKTLFIIVGKIFRTHADI